MVDQHTRDLLSELQNDVLEMVAYGESAAAVAAILCRRAQEFAPQAVCSVLRVDTERRLRHLASPGLPPHYSKAIDGLAIGPGVGSCGRAAYTGEPVEVRDIATDPLWTDFKALALPLGLRACWSTPIKARDGRVIGTFAFYFRSPRGPNALERQIVERCTHLCALAIEHEEIQRRVHELACIDTLSGLPNRSSFNRRIAARTAPGATSFALLIVDLDYLKEINDTLGHAGGDVLIRTLADRLKALAPALEAYRLGGDEFAIIVQSCGTEAEMTAAAQMLISEISVPFQYAGQTLTPFVTVGGALGGPGGPGGLDADTLCQNADFALYHGKETNRGGFVPFRPDLRTSMTKRILAIREIGDALSEDRAVAYYQPIVRLDTSEIVGVEALARIRAANGEVRSVAEFREAMTDPRIACGLTARMLAEVASDVRSWLDAGIPMQHVGFNVAGADFQKGDLERRITEAFDHAGVPLHHLILEVNETVFMGGRDNLVARAVRALRKRGMRVALDDFGTGYASLTHLLNFPVDIIKIDKSFVDRIVDDRQSLVIVEALIAVAGKLDMRIVAEGIETAAQADLLLSLGCVLGQGYHYSRPQPASTTADLLQRFAQRPDGDARTHRLPYRISA